MTKTWHLIAGRYSPLPGGVADYSRILGRDLAALGYEVHVWTGGDQGTTTDAESGVVEHREMGRWGRADLARLGAALDAFPRPRLFSVQYVPHEYGHRGMNLGFARWLRARARAGDDIRPMFHEVWYPFHLIDKPTRQALALVNRLMAREVIGASTRAYVAIPTWERLLRQVEPRPRRPIALAPVPSNLPVVDDPAAVAAIRGRFPEATSIVGTFGTYGPWMAGRLMEVLPPLLEGHPDRAGLILGRHGEVFLEDLLRAKPSLRGRIEAPGELPPVRASLHLQACDLLIQPYPDGLSARRGSAMAGIAHGCPLVTNVGFLSEPLWAESGAVALLPVPDVAGMIRTADRLLGDPPAREALGTSVRKLYDDTFAMRWTVERMIADAEADGVLSRPSVGRAAPATG